MTRVPNLWWSPSEGLFHQYPGEQQYRPLLNGDERRVPWRAERAELPEDAVRLREDFGADYIRVGERISTQDRSDTYVLASGPYSMYLEPVDTGQGHVIELDSNGWVIKHPLPCRANLFGCAFNRAAVTIQGAELGRYTCWLNETGALVIGEKLS